MLGAIATYLAIASAVNACPSDPLPAAPNVPATVSQVTAPDNVLVVIRREGGFCRPPGCFSEVMIRRDGTYRFSTHDAVSATGRFRWGELQQLRSRIARADFEQILSGEPVSNPLPDLCQLAFDGPEAVYRFYPNGQMQEIRGCQTEINADSRLFQQLERLYQRVSEASF
ncbi:MAG: hypothetical protein Fur0046_11240 [Cyanobacteria bacterium J069]|nr:MAG: hypothetical protein D6742_01535 [Cyanobacteria bacterium J069]